MLPCHCQGFLGELHSCYSDYYGVLLIIIMNIQYINNLCSAFCGGAWGATGYGILRLGVNEIFLSFIEYEMEVSFVIENNNNALSQFLI